MVVFASDTASVVGAFEVAAVLVDLALAGRYAYANFGPHAWELGDGFLTGTAFRTGEAGVVANAKLRG